MRKNDVKDSLLAQLQAKGADLAHFQSLIDDYMSYWGMKEDMIKDIKKRGITYTAVSASGNEYTKDNINVKLLPQYTKTMLSILKEMNLTTEAIAEDDEEL